MISARYLLTLPTKNILKLSDHVYAKRQKTKDIQLEVDDQVINPQSLDSIYRLYVFFPAGKISPFLDLAGLEEFYSWTITV